MEKLAAHSSISNTPDEDLEMVVLGQSVWEQYTLEVTIEYNYYGGQKGPRTWNHGVGDWTSEAFVDQTSFEVF